MDIQKKYIGKREYQYKKGEVHLTFILSVNGKQEKEDFIELLETATKELKKELKITK